MYFETTTDTPSKFAGQQSGLHRFQLPEQPGAPDEKEPQPITTMAELRAFMNTHHTAIFQKVQILCYGSSERASEVVQNLYPRLVAALNKSQSGFATPWAMIHRVAANLAIDHHRRETVRRRFRRLEDEGEVADNRVEDSIDTETITKLHKAVARLPVRLQQLLRGIFIDGRRAKELAAELNLSEARVTELKQQALKTLRSVLRGLN